jgi:hypothetical protein
MTTAVRPDKALVTEAKKLGKFKSQEEAVNAALAEYIKLQKRLGLIALAGTIDYDPGYNYKDYRPRKKSRVK